MQLLTELFRTLRQKIYISDLTLQTGSVFLLSEVSDIDNQQVKAKTSEYHDETLYCLDTEKDLLSIVTTKKLVEKLEKLAEYSSMEIDEFVTEALNEYIDSFGFIFEDDSDFETTSKIENENKRD